MAVSMLVLLFAGDNLNLARHLELPRLSRESTVYVGSGSGSVGSAKRLVTESCEARVEDD
jgi:hypothetical protein